ACAPLPFYLYAVTARSGYPLPVAVVERVRARCDNLAGLKVSESPFSAVEPYLGLGLSVFVGSEPLIPQALAAGATGAVSGLSSAFPDQVAAVVRDPSEEGGAALAELRGRMGTADFIANLKRELGRLGLPVRPDMRAPLRATG
ncbi:MAG: dihydrodipicolinate synthase family protein, partial [Gaiellales bacterium]